ncbi:hypothetical protein [Streptomyces wuyuanensis]|uniref:hypothetical protein n=1 Tax=Streptomyces wuyuanensis TaxID=1196353 RepID=UPI0037B8E6E4
MGTWAEFAWGLIFGAATLMVAFNVHGAAERIYSLAMNTVGVSRWFTPTLIRINCGLLGAIVVIEGVAAVI